MYSTESSELSETSGLEDVTAEDMKDAEFFIKAIAGSVPLSQDHPNELRFIDLSRAVNTFLSVDSGLRFYIAATNIIDNQSKNAQRIVSALGFDPEENFEDVEIKMPQAGSTIPLNEARVTLSTDLVIKLLNQCYALREAVQKTLRFPDEGPFLKGQLNIGFVIELAAIEIQDAYLEDSKASKDNPLELNQIRNFIIDAYNSKEDNIKPPASADNATDVYKRKAAEFGVMLHNLKLQKTPALEPKNHADLGPAHVVFRRQIVVSPVSGNSRGGMATS
jgi:hypothetical protein